MEIELVTNPSLDRRVAQRLRDMRAAKGWSLDTLARRCGVSRATLSRIENADVSATTNVLAKLCSAYGLSLSRLMHIAEDDFAAHVPRDRQSVWTDPTVGFRRRIVSPPSRSLAGEALECTLDPDIRIHYDEPPSPGMEHHLLLLHGRLAVTVDDRTHNLLPRDSLRYKLHGASQFETPADVGARYIMFLV